MVCEIHYCDMFCQVEILTEHYILGRQSFLVRAGLENSSRSGAAEAGVGLVLSAVTVQVQLG